MVSPRGPLTATFTLPIDNTALAGATTLDYVSPTNSINYSPTHMATGNTLTATPASPLALLAPIRWRLQTSLRSTGGQALPSPVVVNFTTRDGIWSSPLPVETGVETAQAPAVALGFFGSGLVVFQQPNANGHRHPFAARFNGATSLVEAPIDLIAGTNTALFPTVAASSSTTAMVGWLEASGSFDLNPVVRRYAFGSNTFAPPVTLDASPNPVSFLALAMDDSGNGAAVYRQSQSTSSSAPSDCWVSRYSGATDTWSTPALLETGVADCSSLALNSDSDGNLTVAFAQGSDLFVTQRSVGSATWTTPLNLESRPGPVQLRRVLSGTSPVSLVWVVWLQEDSAWARSYSPLTNSWDAAPFDLDGINTNRPTAEVAISTAPTLGAVVVFTQPDTVGALTRSAFATHFTTNWSTPVPIETLAGTVTDPQVVLSVTGPAMASFAGSSSFGARLETWSARFDGSSWAAPVQRSMSPVASNSAMRLTVDGAGRVLGVWEYADTITSTSIYFSRFE